MTVFFNIQVMDHSEFPKERKLKMSEKNYYVETNEKFFGISIRYAAVLGPVGIPLSRDH